MKSEKLSCNVETAQRAIHALIFSIILIFAFAYAAYAERNVLVNATVLDLPATGDAGNINCALRVYNPNSFSVFVSGPGYVSQFGYGVRSTPSTDVLLEPYKSTDFIVSISIASDGNYRVNLPVWVKTRASGPQMKESGQDTYFSVSRGEFRASTFRALFVNPIIVDTDDQGDSYKIFRTLPPPRGWADGPEFNIERPGESEMESLRRETVYTTDWSGTEDGRLSAFSTKFLKTGKRDKSDTFEQTVNMGAYATAKGILKFTGADGLLHPAYYWKVVAYALIGGNKVQLAKTRVKHDGSWTMEVLPTGFPVRIEYQPRNRYFSFADVADNRYHSFTSGATYTANPDGTINEYTQALYTASSDLINLGELYNDGINLWANLIEKGGGIAPYRDESIIVYYPNDEYDCGHGDDVPWSCSASAEGFLWIAPQHAGNRGAFPHELGHQLHYEYWGDTPGGGPHPIMQCTSTDTAMSEGFADFVSHWARFSRTQVVSGDDAFPVEDPTGACADLSQNQLWVAATFWDMYDSLDDGADTLRFTKQGAPIALFLGNVGGDSMADYRWVYLVAAGSSSLWVFNTFNQNKQAL